MLTRHWNHFVVWDKDFGQPLHSNSVHFENGVPPVYFRSNIRKCTQLYKCQERNAWLPNEGHYQPYPRTHYIRKFGFPCALLCDWSFFPLFSFSFRLLLFFLLPQATLYRLHRCARLITFWVILNFCSNTRLPSAVKLGNSKPLLVLAPWSQGEKGPLSVQIFLQCVQKMYPSVIKAFLKSGAPLWIIFFCVWRLFLGRFWIQFSNSYREILGGRG